MKKQFKLCSILAMIIISMFTFAGAGIFFSPVNATYVEGLITKDTVWTLVDSPFVVSKDVTVAPAVTLTIEPGVTVKFGGNFSLFVAGSLQAVGTANQKITFTSNYNESSAGDWIKIEFTGATQSTLTYCVIEYAVNAVTMENSNVEVKNTEIRFCNENGVAAWNSTLRIQDSVISDSNMSGIYLADGNQATIVNSTIKANTDGLMLSGAVTQTINITENKVQSNTYSGITLNLTDYSGVSILNNSVSANKNGFIVSSQAPTQITNNSISYNDVGVLYSQGSSHTAHWNDLYENELAMDVTWGISVYVNAEYNYWGHETGPFHATLNPNGQGNPVGGDGKNLDFIFFLSAPVGQLNQRPVARLLSDKVRVVPNQKVTFFGTTSSDDKRLDMFFFDFGDSIDSSWQTLSVFQHKYSSVGSFQASLRVMDDYGVISNNVAAINVTVQALTSLELTLTLESTDTSSEGTVPITIYVKTGGTPVVSADITVFAIVGGAFSPITGTTDSSGYWSTTFTAPNVTQAGYIRIVARASKSGYADGADFTYLQVLPKLAVQVAMDADTVRSEDSVFALVHVSCNATPIGDVQVSVSATSGTFFEAVGFSDADGDVVFNFTAPKTFAQLNVNITATASKEGYYEGHDNTVLTVNPRLLTVQITSPAMLESEADSSITVLVTDNAIPVEGANVTIASDLGGAFSPNATVTDSSGNCMFIFTAPELANENTVTVIVSVAKPGYDNVEKQATIVVTPISAPVEGIGGLPWLTIILILIPVIAVAVVAVLIKMKIINISRGDTEDYG
jgi:hypothetical protein